MAITHEELHAGLVLHLDPDVLERDGGRYSCDPAYRVLDGHFFLCLAVGDSHSTWLPLYSNPGFGRTELSRGGRTGHPKWIAGTFYWHATQVWDAPHAAVDAASVAGGDMSAAGSRNELDPTKLPIKPHGC
jgi:hypothetical protein